jgi:hypothetical protein
MKTAARNAAVLRHGDKAFTVAVTKSDGSAVPVDPAKLSVVVTKRPEPVAPTAEAAAPTPAPEVAPVPAAKPAAKAKPARGNGKTPAKALPRSASKPAPAPKRPAPKAAAKKASKAKKPPAKKPAAAAKARRR